MKKSLCPNVKVLSSLVVLFSLGIGFLSMSINARADTLYLAPNGNDAWSGSLAKPNAAKDDGPLKTLAAARDKIRAKRAAAPPTAADRVVIAEGTYNMTAPLLFSPADSGSTKFPISYEATPGAKPIFNGGRVLSDWKRSDDGIWTTQIPDVKSGDWYFEQLWVNDERAIRARTPNKFYHYAAGVARPENDPTGDDGATLAKRAFVARKDDIAPLQKLSSAQLKGVTLVAYHTWESSRHHIAGIDWKSNTVALGNPINWAFSPQNPARYQLENFRAALDSPGEWFLDRASGTLSYIPRPGEDMTKAQVVAPVAESFIQIQGNPAAGKFVTDLTFRGLAFRYGQYLLPPKGYAAMQAEFRIPAAIMVDGARNIVFEDCELSHIGIYGMWFRNGVRDSTVTHCLLRDLGAGGIRIGPVRLPEMQQSGNITRDLGLDTARYAVPEVQQSGNITVDNNIIHGGSRIHHGGVGVWIGWSGDNKITHNDIGDFIYTGISSGWEWGYQVNPNKRNLIEFNHIHHIGQGILSDMGGIYTLGPSEGTVISNNVVNDVYAYSYGGWGLYTDEGSTDITLENNLVFNTKSGGFHQHYGRDNIVRNNIFALASDGQVARTRVESFQALTFENNIVYADGQPIFKGDWTKQITTRNNLYWNASGPTFKSNTLEQRQAAGQDKGSLVADPMFVDAKNFDFHLKTNSPATKVGFVPFEYSRAGVYGETAWENLAANDSMPKLEVAPLPPAAIDFSEGFEGLAIGSAPSEATMIVEGKGDSISVSQDAAASGQRSLKVVDVPGLRNAYNPHFYFSPHYSAGVVRVAFDLRTDAKTQMYHEWRNDAAPYKAGPSFGIVGGKLVVNGQPLMDVPTEIFVHFEVSAKLGASADGTWDLKVTMPGGETQTFDNLKTRDADWRQADWVGFVSDAVVNTTYYLDNLQLQNSDGAMPPVPMAPRR